MKTFFGPLTSHDFGPYYRDMRYRLKDSLLIMKFDKTDLFGPLMTEFELSGHFWSDKYAMTSSVEIFRN